jgi:Cu/Ag efflux pump CusA
MRAQFRCRSLVPILAACLGVACNEGIAAERQAVLVTVTAEAPGCSSDQMDDRVTPPIATKLDGTPGVQRICSRATLGRVVVWIEFASGTDVYKARQATAERMQMAARELPKAVLPTLAPALVPDKVMLVALWVAGKTPEANVRRATELRELAERVVRRRLLAIPGVAWRTVAPAGPSTCSYLVAGTCKTTPTLCKNYC